MFLHLLPFFACCSMTAKFRFTISLLLQGCDASILLNSKDSEMKCSKNFGIRKLEAIARLKFILEVACPRQVSCADIIALAARDSVALSGGPLIQVPLGRKDSTTCNTQLADVHLPSTTIDVDGFLRIFMGKGMNLQESVAILGGHTLGAGHCINIVDRIYKPNPIDQMDPNYHLALKLGCPSKIPITNLTIIPNDITPSIFDNQYYREISLGKGLFSIDTTLSRDPRTVTIVNQFAADQDYFFEAFSSAFVKLSSANVLTGNMGEVRLQCDQVNR
ncbi:peroxidase 29 isoform X2 [Spinacia oleracea]|uniref:peroxidase n=1 Tax=Spinacia oleracea TaxID=3562 RepID=A0ABM3QTJ1_SPIOL|nr:peroxidase 29-like isoform X2 [Spinacia oleracea]